MLTIASPCVLPMAPVVLGASIAQPSRLRPLFVALGFAVAFSAAALVLGAFSSALPASPGLLRELAALALVTFGILMLWTRPMDLLGERLGGLRLASTGCRGAPAVGMPAGSSWD